MDFLIIIFLIFFNYHISIAALNENNIKNIFCIFSAKSIAVNGIINFQIKDINEQYCTHLIYDYVDIDNNGEVKSLDPIFDFYDNYGLGNIIRFNEKKQYNNKLKSLVAFGGWDNREPPRRYYDIFRNEANQFRFIESAVDFVLKYNFDGIVLYWAYIGNVGDVPNVDKYTLTSLLKKLNIEFKKRKLMLVINCHGYDGTMDQSYNVKEISQNVDYIYVISYNLYNEFSRHIGLTSALYLHPNETDKALSVDSIINAWISRGANPSQIVVSVPLYGRTFTLKNKNETEPGSLFIGPGHLTQNVPFRGFITYMELCQIIYLESWTVKWEPTQKNSYAFKDDQWISYENDESIKHKAQYVIEKKLGGFAAIAIEYDDFRGVCGEKHALLKALNKYLNTKIELDDKFILNISIFKEKINEKPLCIYHKTENINI